MFCDSFLSGNPAMWWVFVWQRIIGVIYNQFIASKEPQSLIAYKIYAFTCLKWKSNDEHIILSVL